MKPKFDGKNGNGYQPENTSGVSNPPTQKTIVGGLGHEMAVGDPNSKERGSGARACGDKPRWDLMPLDQIGYIMEAQDKIINLREEIDDALMMEMLGCFQAGHIDADQLLLAAVAYNWNKVDESDWREGNPVPLDESLYNVIRVWEFGLKKYAEFNWAKGMPWMVGIGCFARHILWHFKGQELDDESGELHSAHVVCNAQMLAHYSRYYKEGDDRPIHCFVRDVESTTDIEVVDIPDDIQTC